MTDDKFKVFYPLLGFDYIQPNFFIPETKSSEFLKIEPEYKQIISNGGFISYINQSFIIIPNPQSLLTKQAKDWLINMIDEMRQRAIKYLSQDNFIEYAINIRNLFISLAWNIIGDCCVANELKGKFPLCQNNHAQAEIFNQQQRITLLDRVLNEDELARYLTFPY